MNSQNAGPGFPTPEMIRRLGIHFLSGVPLDPNLLAETQWLDHLENARKSHEALVQMLELSPVEALRRLKFGQFRFPLWRKLNLGTHESASELREEYCKRFGPEDTEATIGCIGSQIDSLTVESKRCWIPLYRATVEEITGITDGDCVETDSFTHRTTYCTIEDHLGRLGYNYVPDEVAVQLMLQTEGKQERALSIFMEPLEERCAGYPLIIERKIFELIPNRKDGFCLGLIDINHSCFHPDQTIVFAQSSLQKIKPRLERIRPLI